MKLADKLYEIVCARYDRLWRVECSSKIIVFGIRDKYLNYDLLDRWHGMIRSHGMVTSKDFVHRTGLVCIKDPAMWHNEWIVVPDEMAFKIVALGALPC